LTPTVPLPAERVVVPLLAEAGAASATEAANAPTPAITMKRVVLLSIKFAFPG